ncbi:universal stress protein [Planctomycetales bacterium ZRK34]|nr:universal stress protein [Planctomycetales bacterium ZRK34]
MNRLLVAIDFSDISSKVLTTSLNLARALAGELYLIHVAEPDPIFVGHEVDPQVDREALAQRLRVEHSRLQEMAAQVESAGVKVTPLLVQGPTVEKILDEAQQLEASLIVMGTHGHGALYQTLVGSVSSGVLRKTSCPVVMVPASGQADT